MVAGIENMTHTAIILNGHIDTTFLYIPTKIQPNTTYTAYIIAKYVAETNMALKATYMLHLPISSCADIRQLCQYIYLI